jgi:hypothetical protein
MTEPPSADKATGKGTAADGDILYRLGIDVDTNYGTMTNPEGV